MRCCDEIDYYRYPCKVDLLARWLKVDPDVINEKRALCWDTSHRPD